MAQRRRRTVRALAAVQVSVEGEAAAYNTRDISMGGMFVEGAHWLVGADLRVLVRHRGSSLVAEVNVATVTNAGTGVRFKSQDRAFRDNLRRFMIALVVEGHQEAEEKRQAPRRSSSTIMALMDDHGEYRATAVEVSEVGARLLADRRPRPGSMLYVYIPFFADTDMGYLSLAEINGTRARVVRTLDDGFAVAFVAPSERFLWTVSRLSPQDG